MDQHLDCACLGEDGICRKLRSWNGTFEDSRVGSRNIWASEVLFFVFLYCIISLEGDFESVHGWFLLRVANMDFSRGVGIWVFFATGGTG